MLMEGMDKRRDRPAGRGLLLPVARRPGEGREAPRPVRPWCSAMCSRAWSWLSLEQATDIPAEWLKRLTESFLTEEEKKQIEAMGGFDKLMEMLQEQMKNGQGERRRRRGRRREPPRQGPQLPHRRRRLSSRRHPHRPGQGPPRQGDQGLGQARVQEPRRLGRARHPQHQGRPAPPAQIRPPGRAGRAGHEGHDQGHGQQGLSRPRSCSPSGATPSRCCCSSTSAARWTATSSVCEELFSAARTEFKTMEFFYFHNCLYESVWKDNRRRHAEKLDTWDVLQQVRPRLQGDLRRRRHHEPL